MGNKTQTMYPYDIQKYYFERLEEEEVLKLNISNDKGCPILLTGRKK